MKITSPDFEDGGNIPGQFTCSGPGLRPKIEISEIPPDAAELVLFIDDPDAPSGTYNHWSLAGLIPSDEVIISNSLPNVAYELINSSGKSSYVPPCPPNGTHRYIFTIFALSEKIPRSPNQTSQEFEKIMLPKISASAKLMGLYQKPS